ncbi:hypothetical protein COO60DRAFT_1708968 [Scenedesmus sp. NREL 46B-D3]|nr:hypothetical protein COO60DRAFT_1708968 [Scenedesmus sp. NREL 46B-D3]
MWRSALCRLCRWQSISSKCMPQGVRSHCSVITRTDLSKHAPAGFRAGVICYLLCHSHCQQLLFTSACIPFGLSICICLEPWILLPPRVWPLISALALVDPSTLCIRCHVCSVHCGSALCLVLLCMPHTPPQVGQCRAARTWQESCFLPWLVPASGCDQHWSNSNGWWHARAVRRRCGSQVFGVGTCSSYKCARQLSVLQPLKPRPVTSVLRHQC